ncbi:TetR/AcrR family transcriptional regulator [Streptomyces sp. NPDC090021]|uniref:TetR/AcrR family transcriptional regulator n=1 Tax=Streptomyces sp. NPDC090021 TaxID=3365919 RepID=UPI003804A2E2
MRSVMRDDNDRTNRAVMRDEALRLFAESGPDAVSVRQIAQAAGVSPGLVLHHFGSKDGLRQDVDQHVLAVFEAVLGEVSAYGPEGPEQTRGQARSLGAAVLRHLPEDSPVPAYLGRLLMSDAEAGRTLFRRLFELSLRTLEEMERAGQATRGHDPQVRAAFLLVNDLALLLLRPRLTEVLGTDPLSAAGLERWAPEVLAVYGGGLTAEGTGDTA